MSDRADAWVPLYIADYLKDTRHLSTAEHGAYILLLMNAWTSGGALPLDERRLARIAGMDRDEWAESRDVLLGFFIEAPDGFHHKRVDEELAKADANLEQKRAAGRASAAKRALQRDENDRSTDVATGYPTKVQREPQRKGNPSPSPSSSSLRSEEDDVGGDTRASARDPDPPLPINLITLTEEVCRAAGIRHADPGPIMRHQKLVQGWLDEGFDPEADIMPGVRSGIATATERINSLQRFDRDIRQTRARREAGHEHLGHDTPTNPLLAAVLAKRRQADGAGGDEHPLRLPGRAGGRFG